VTAPCPYGCTASPYVDRLRPRMFRPSESYQVLCPACGAFGPVCSSIQEAGAEWDKMRVRSCGGGA